MGRLQALQGSVVYCVYSIVFLRRLFHFILFSSWKLVANIAEAGHISIYSPISAIVVLFITSVFFIFCFNVFVFLLLIIDTKTWFVK